MSGEMTELEDGWFSCAPVCRVERPMDPREDEKRAAARAAAEEVEDGMAVGLGTGSTMAHFLPLLARRALKVRCVATSPGTEEAARALGLSVQPFDLVEGLDLAIDGADQVAPDFWIVKGRGGAHTREKVVAAAARRFVVIVSSDKIVEELRPPLPVEVLRFGLAATLKLLGGFGPVQPRDGGLTPDGNVIVHYLGRVDDPVNLSAKLDAVPGVVGHGLFPPALVSEVLVGRSSGDVERRSPAG
jgi:ribose 5-phosphate isomerase A